MKKILLFGAVLGTMAAASSANAHGFFSLSIGIPPVSVHLGSSPAVYVQPAPVYVRPAPVYVRPVPVLAVPPAIVVHPPVILAPPCPPKIVVRAARHHHRHHHAPRCCR